MIPRTGKNPYVFDYNRPESFLSLLSLSAMYDVDTS